MSYEVFNGIVRVNDSQFDIVKVGTYDPTSSVMFHFDQAVIWADGTTKVPLDIRVSTINCPFEDRLIRDFPPGRNLFFGITAGIAGAAILLSTVYWRLFWNFPIPELTDRREIQTLDLIAYLTIFIEMCQFIYFGPATPFFLNAFTIVINVATLDFTTIVLYQNGIFTAVWLCAVSAVGLWLFSMAFLMFGLDHKLKQIPGTYYIGTISEAFAPLVSDWLFLPILSILIDVFLCDKGVVGSSGPVDFTDTYLAIDCYTTCWTGVHRIMAVVSAVAILFFVPLVVCFRPIWQEIQLHINVKMSGTYFMFKSAVQITVLVLSKSLKGEFPVVHKFVYFAVVIALVAALFRIDCYSYRRASFWHKLSIFAVIWTCLIAIINSSVSSNSNVWLAIHMFGWSVIATFGFAYQGIRLPSYLYSRSGIDAGVLFKFAFQRTTIDLIGALKDSFNKVGHRNTVCVPQMIEVVTRMNESSVLKEGSLQVDKSPDEELSEKE